MEQARRALQQRLVELVGEGLSRGVHVVLAKESWLHPEKFRTKEPSTASVAAVEKQLWPLQPIQARVESMCVVGSSWPCCLARAVTKAREAQRLLLKRTLREGKKKHRMEETLRTKAKRRAKRNQRDLARKLRARANPADEPAPARGSDGEDSWDRLLAEVSAVGQADGETPGLPSAP